MAGETYDDELTGSKDEFLSRPKHHRFAVAVAGPLMNIGLAIVLLASTYTIGIQVPSYRTELPIVGALGADSSAEAAGVRVQDRILAIDGNPMSSWQDTEITIATSPGEILKISLEREGSRIETEVVVTKAEGTEMGTIGVEPWIPFIIAGTLEGSPARLAGLKLGDEIVEVSSPGRVIKDPYSMPSFISEHEGQPLLFKLRRGNEFLEFAISPAVIAGKVLIGVERQRPSHIEQYNLIESLNKSIQRNWELTLLTCQIVGKIVTGKTSLKTMSGPIEIARYSGAAASGGLVSLLLFMALVSLQLGIFNLFPIPILDGGVIAMLAFETLIRRDLSIKVKERVFQVGFIFLILLMGAVILNDISKYLPFSQ